MMKLQRRALAGALVALLAVAGAACSDDDDDTTETGSAPEETTTTAGDEPAGETVEIIGTNDDESYRFEDVPDSVAAGTTLSLTNTGTEPHELIALLIPESETRSVEEIARLTEAEQEAIFGDGEPATVILAATGTTDTPGAVVGDGTLTEPGRYAIVCFLPVGSTDDILNASGPPEGDFEPHVARGMFAELTVE